MIFFYSESKSYPNRIYMILYVLSFLLFGFHMLLNCLVDKKSGLSIFVRGLYLKLMERKEYGFV